MAAFACRDSASRCEYGQDVAWPRPVVDSSCTEGVDDSTRGFNDERSGHRDVAARGSEQEAVIPRGTAPVACAHRVKDRNGEAGDDRDPVTDDLALDWYCPPLRGLYAAKRGRRPLIRVGWGVCQSTPQWSRRPELLTWRGLEDKNFL